jgi:two-component system nitrogen regulation sensor histidine kinase NtrY
MIAQAAPPRAEASARSFSVTPAVELLVLGAAVAIGLVSYFAITSNELVGRLIPPPLIALLLVANIVPGVIVLMLIGRRIARRRAARSPVGGTGQLHVRLVAIFSVLSAVPMLLVTIVASLLFQYGIEFWYSGQARTVFDNAIVLTRQSYQLILDRWEGEAFAMAGDLAPELARAPAAHLSQAQFTRSRSFTQFYLSAVYFHSLSESALFAIRKNGSVEVLATVNPYGADLPRLIAPALHDAFPSLRRGQRSAVSVTNDRIKVFTRVPGSDPLFLYAGRVTDQRTMASQFHLATQASNSYHKLITRARSIQLRFNAGLLAVSLLIVGIAVWIALAIADRLVRPVGELVAAARAVESGDLSARVPDPKSRDEVGTLAKAFNQMTGRLESQRADLTSANTTLENRRALIEAVMGGVSAGVVATAADGTIRIANASAERLLGSQEGGPVGRRLADVAPELDALLRDDAAEAVVQVRQGEGPGERTLAVRIARTDAGPILTFDDITQQVLDQRRAAWADVARRIAHEIKNPLTPIQLAAERLQRRYGGKVEADDTTFARLTETIVRQVGDLRRMVDEFSSFARMPKPVFRAEALLDTARQALFLHEVAHPAVRFELRHDEPGPTLTCDRRQIGQALTNIVKNAVEAIEARGEPEGSVVMTLGEKTGRVTIVVEDDGVGLPVERDRIVEPYVTTRARGTGLGLAIVKKIVEEHFGTVTFADRDGGGTVVSMVFDSAAARAAGEGAASPEPVAPATPFTLVRT